MDFDFEDVFENKPPEPHPFQPTAGPDSWGGNCGRCSGPGGAPWHVAAGGSTDGAGTPAGLDTHEFRSIEGTYCNVYGCGQPRWVLVHGPLKVKP